MENIAATVIVFLYFLRLNLNFEKMRREIGLSANSTAAPIYSRFFKSRQHFPSLGRNLFGLVGL